VSLVTIGFFFFKLHLTVDVEESIVNALYRLRITDQLFKSYVLHEWCVHNRLFNAYYEVKFKKTPDIIITVRFDV
jgi:isoleucyl-tRNA synthetase